MNELVSIIIPAYNKAALTLKTVESVLAQTYQPIEIIVVDDGSSDHTCLALKPYAARIKYVYKKNGGACSARNLGFKLSSGEYIGFLDCDDVYLPEKVALSVAYLKEHQDAGFVYNGACFVDDEEIVGEYSHPQSKKGNAVHRLILNNCICNSTPLIRRSALEDVGGFDESIFMPADWDLWMRLSEKYKIGYIDQPLTKYQVTNNYILNHIELSKEEEIKVLNKVFQRNPQYKNSFQKKALAYLHLRYAQVYFLKNDWMRMKKEFCLSVSTYWMNVKAFLILGGFVFARQILRKKLERRILRNVG